MVTVVFSPGWRFVKVWFPTVRSPTSARTVEFSGSLPIFLTVMRTLTFSPTVVDVVLGSTEYTSRACGDVVVVTTIANTRRRFVWDAAAVVVTMREWVPIGYGASGVNHSMAVA